MQYDEKSPAVREGMDAVAKALGGPGLGDGSACALCGATVVREVDPEREGAFKDGLGLKEFGISQMCQRCQDGAFAPPWYDVSLGDVHEAFGAGLQISPRNPHGFVLARHDGEELGQADDFEGVLKLLARECADRLG